MPIEIEIEGRELYDEAKGEFIPSIGNRKIVLEHSLKSVSKWESKWHKPFLSKEPRSSEENLDYIKCMTITQNVDDVVYKLLTQKNVDEITSYINDSMTATHFSETANKGSFKRIITSELIYCWMVSLNIPFECQNWHLNRLLTLIRTINEENSPKKKISKNDLYKNNTALNEARRKKLNSKG